jgi:hypothetical protein
VSSNLLAHVARLNVQKSQATLPQVGLVSLAQSPAQPAVEDSPLFAAQPSNSNLLFADEVGTNTPEATVAQPSQQLINDEEKVEILKTGEELFNHMATLTQQAWGTHEVENGKLSVLTLENYREILSGKLRRGEANTDEENQYHLLARLNFSTQRRTGITQEDFLAAIERKIERTNENHTLGQHVESSWIALADAYATSDAVVVAQSAP